MTETLTAVKQFRVACWSKNLNSFGLRGMVLIARDGETWEVAANSINVRSVYSVVEVPYEGETLNFAARGFETPRRFGPAPQFLVKAVGWDG